MLEHNDNTKKRYSPHRLTFGILLGLFLLALMAPPQVMGQAKVGTTGAQFLELGVSARAMGMAEAFTAVADDISAVYYNPAGLVYLYGREASFTYIKMPADINYGFGAIGMPLESIGGVLGISFYGLNSGDMIETDYYQGTQEGTGRTFSWRDYALAVSYGRYLSSFMITPLPDGPPMSVRTMIPVFAASKSP